MMRMSLLLCCFVVVVYGKTHMYCHLENTSQREEECGKGSRAEIDAMCSSQKEGKALAAKVKTSFSIVVTGGPDKATKTWLLDLKSDPVFIGEKVAKADCQVTMSDDDFVKLAEKKIKPEQAFMQGKLKIKGNLAKAMKLKDLLDSQNLKLNAKL